MMRDILKLARVQIVVGVLFIFFKTIRPYSLKNNPPEFIKVFLPSFPNFCEAIIGVITLTMIGIYFNKNMKWKNATVYVVATFLATVFVLTQELKIHNLGGNNIYDSNDMIFSIVGLVVGFIMNIRIKPTFQSNPI